MVGSWATKSTLKLIGFITASVVVIGGAALAVVHVQDQTGTTVGTTVPSGAAKAGSTTSASNGSAGTSASGQAAAAGSTAGASAGASASGQAKVPSTTTSLPAVTLPTVGLPTLPTVKLPTITAPTLTVPTLPAITTPTLPALPTVPAVPELPNLGIPVPVVALGIIGLSPYASGSFPLVVPGTPGVTKHFCFGIDGSATCKAIIVPSTGTMNLSMTFSTNASLLAPTFTPNSCTGGYSISLSGVTPGTKVQASIAGLSTTQTIDAQGKSVRASLCD